MLPHLKTALQKTARYCAYQERSHNEAYQKLRNLKLTDDEANEVISQLIQEDYLNEERYACLFARSKFNQKQWGRVRITNELKFKGVSPRNIQKALSELNESNYSETLVSILNKKYNLEKNKNEDLKLKQKVCDYALRRGFESGLVFNTYDDQFE